MKESAIVKAEAIIAEIREAFSEVSRGNGISLHEADIIDSYGTETARKKARELDTDTCWWEVPSELLDKFNGALFFMDAEGYRYYLPAYMTYGLKTYAASTLAMDVVLTTLFPTSEESFKRFSLLDARQKKAVARFLWFIATETGESWANKLNIYNATKALEDIWYPYLTE